MHSNIKKIINNAKNIDYKLEKFSKDIHQISPEKRIHSINNIISAIPIQEKSSIIDLGTGYGYGAVLLNALGHNVIGMDIFNRKLVDGIKYWNTHGINIEKKVDFENSTLTSGKLYFANMDSRKINHFPNESVDLVTSFYLSTYMIGKNGAYQNVHKVLKPDGKLVVSTDGPFKKLDLMNKQIVNISGKIFTPKGLKFEEMIVLDKKEAHDRYILIYKK